MTRCCHDACQWMLHLRLNDPNRVYPVCQVFWLYLTIIIMYIKIAVIREKVRIQILLLVYIIRSAEGQNANFTPRLWFSTRRSKNHGQKRKSTMLPQATNRVYN